MKKYILIIAVFSILLGFNLFASNPIIVDSTGMDFQNYWYTGTFGQQILVDEYGKIHICYTKTWCTQTDTGYQVMYTNVTDSTKIPIPSQEPYKEIQPAVVYIDGGYNGTPIYLYYGVGNRFYGYNDDDNHLQALAKLSADSTQVISVGLQDDWSGYSDPYWLANPIEIKADNVNGIVHCINTQPDGMEVIYWNFDGTNFSIRYFLINAWYHSGKIVPSKFIRNGTKGADLAVSNDGQEVTVATLHTAGNIFLHKGYSQGSIWEDDFIDGLGNGSVIALFDTTNTATGENIPNNDPKPYTEVQVSYDDQNNLHVVYDATYKDIYIDTSNALPWIYWYRRNSSIAGDTNAVFYDGSEHPKSQLRYWNSITETHSLLAECEYPQPGASYQWYSHAIFDSGLATWGKWVNDGPIANLKFFVNKNRQPNEPEMICVWEEMQGDVTALTDVDEAFGYTYYAYKKDIKISVSDDGINWSIPYNITQSPDRDEGEVSVYSDVIDNKIHLVYSEDSFPGSDLNLAYADDYENNFLHNWPSIQNRPYVTIRKPSVEQVKIMYREFDLSEIPINNIKSKKYFPYKFDLAQNYPNPFNNRTIIRYELSEASHLDLSIYNLLGQKIKTLVDGVTPRGSYQVCWDGTNEAGLQVSTGIYVYKLKTEAGVKTKKMFLLK